MCPHYGGMVLSRATCQTAVQLHVKVSFQAPLYPFLINCDVRNRTLQNIAIRNSKIWLIDKIHGTARVSEIGAIPVPRNSMELLIAKLAHRKFHGIPWKCSCQRNWHTPSSMEFHGIPWNCSCHRNWRTWSSMEFHGIPWNCSCQRNWRTSSSVEFHGTSRVIEIGALEVPWNSMEFHGTARVSEIGALLVPWNSMEFHGTARVSEISALLVPWNSMELLVSVKSLQVSFTNLCFFYQYLHYTLYAFPPLLIT